jgi:hypothetical protein
MPTIVYTLACETDRGGAVVAVYADRERAVDAARNLAIAHAARLRAEDEATFKAPVAPDLYQVRLEDLRCRIVVTTYHRLLREPGSSHRWIVQRHEIAQTWPGYDRSLAEAMSPCAAT